jgi:serine/threonine-protein kinase
MALRTPTSAASVIRCQHCGAEHPATFTHCPSTGRSLATGEALVGRVVADRYRVLSLLGEGGMGAVYAAEHLLIGRRVALKRLHPELAADAKAIARFHREARAAAATGHENIVDILDMGFGEDGAPFLVMEYLAGQSLAELLRREGRLPPTRAASIVGQLLDALAAVHRRDIVHRDLKPDNLLLVRRAGRQDFVKILDFGISKMKRDDDGMALTRTGVTLGTPFYMSPEHARGVRELDHRVDLYAAGVILYECLTGRVPYREPNYHALLQAILQADPPRVRDLAPEVPEALAEIVHRAIARSPADRFPSARAMHEALVPFGADPPLDVDEPGLGGWDSGERPRTASTALLAARSSERPAATANGLSPKALAPLVPLRRGTGPREDGAAPGTEPAPLRPRLASDADPEPAGAAVALLREVRERYASRAMTPAGMRATGAQAPSPAAAGAHAPNAPTNQATQAPGVATTPGGAPVGSAPSSAAGATPSRAPRAVTPGLGIARTGALPPTARARASAGEIQVRASLVVAALEHVERARGEGAVARVVEALEPGVRAHVAGMMLPVAWLPLGHYDRVLTQIEREVGGSAGSLAFEVGAYTAARDLPTTHRALLQSATPSMAVERIPQIWRVYHSGGEARVEEVATGSWRVTLSNVVPDSLPHAQVLAGFFQRLLELVGAREARASLTSARGRGDERTVIALRWR